MMDPARTQIIRRRVNIDFESARADGWPLDKKDTEELLNSLSFVFPAGEKFFIESLQNYQARITDPVLKEQVKLFIYQEAMHSKEHARCNRVLLEAHPYGDRIERFTLGWLNLNRRFMPKASQLALTCAFEHFTTMLADGLLSNQESFVATTHPAFASLWMWHAVEETEHKAVCFDAYQYLFGKGPISYLHRVTVMFFATLGFLITAAVGVRQIKKGNKGGEAPGTTDENRSKLASLWYLVKSVVFLPLYLDYYRPSFHPWNHDNSHLIEEWKQRYQDFGAIPDVAASDARA